MGLHPVYNKSWVLDFNDTRLVFYVHKIGSSGHSFAHRMCLPGAHTACIILDATCAQVYTGCLMLCCSFSRHNLELSGHGLCRSCVWPVVLAFFFILGSFRFQTYSNCFISLQDLKIDIKIIKNRNRGINNAKNCGIQAISLLKRKIDKCKNTLITNQNNSSHLFPKHLYVNLSYFLSHPSPSRSYSYFPLNANKWLLYLLPFPLPLALESPLSTPFSPF